jgi:ParB/RepB/Spo0J family partition protein
MEINKQEYTLVPVDSIKPHPRNPRRGNVESIQESIQENGFYGAVIVQRSTGYIIAGCHRWKAAKANGAVQIPAFFVDVDDDRALRILLADNRTNDLAGYDEQSLTALLSELTTTPAALANRPGFRKVGIGRVLDGAAALEKITEKPDGLPDRVPLVQEGGPSRNAESLS